MRKTHLIREGRLCWCGRTAQRGSHLSDWFAFSCYPPRVRCGTCLRLYLARDCIPPTGLMTIPEQITAEESDPT